MTKPFTITDLITAVAKRNPDSITYQWLNACSVGGMFFNHEATKRKPERKYTEITFRCDNEKGRDFMSNNKQLTAVILWLPREDVQAILNTLSPLEKDEKI